MDNGGFYCREISFLGEEGGGGVKTWLAAVKCIIN